MLRALRGRVNQGFKTAAALTAAFCALSLCGWSQPALAHASDAGTGALDCARVDRDPLRCPQLLAPVLVPLLAAASNLAEPSASSPLTREPSAPVTVIELGERRAEAKDAADHLAATPGAVIQDAGGAGQRKSLSLRGASSNAVLVLLDGVPLAGPGESMDLSRIPSAALERIEVLRGAGSRYGPGGLGGVVNLVTRAPGGQRVFAAASQGSFMTTRADVGGSTPLGPGDLLVLAHGLRSDGDFTFAYDDAPVLRSAPTVLLRTNNQALLGGALARYRASLGATTLDFLAEGTAEQRGLAGPVQNPSPTAGQQTVRATASARATTSVVGGGLLSVLGFGRVDSTLLSGSAFGASGSQQLASAAGAEAVFTRAFGRHGLTALITAGGEWLRAPNAAPAWGRAGVMLGDEVFFFDGRLGVDASARLDVAGPFVVVSPKAGAALHLPLGFELRVSAGQASRPPSFYELYLTQGTLLPNPSLRPERALTADATVAWSSGQAAVSLTGFGSLYEDLISYEYYPPSLAKPFNFQAARVAGLEFEARAKPLPWLDASASYTFLSTQNLRDDPRYYLKSLPFRPAHRVQARVVAGVPLASVRGEVLAQSAQFMNRTESLALPARVFVNVGISTTPLKNPALTASFEVKNLLDAQSQDVDGYPLPPRAAFLTLALAWDGARP